FDRFTAYIIEETKGAFPLWLSPKQAVIVPVHYERHLDYAYELQDKLKALGVRVHVDGRTEKLGYRVREAQMSRIPYQLVVGDSEVENHTVNVRRYGVEGSESMTIEAFLEKIEKELKERKSVA
ncbi:MAG: threonine--tRNA ligase, partial [Erysipelotrichaceae bacterium]|nr:threonine--tRNA ligase [Erysipelotrichaceae bacterium]